MADIRDVGTVCDSCGVVLDVVPDDVDSDGRPCGRYYMHGAAACSCGLDVCAACKRTCSEHDEVECPLCACAGALAVSA